MLLDRIPVRLRLSLGHAVWMALLFLITGMGVYRFVEHDLFQSVDASLLSSARSMRDARYVQGFGSNLMQQLLSDFLGERFIRPYAQLVDLSGRISLKTENTHASLPVTPLSIAQAEKGLVTFETFRRPDRSKMRQITLPVLKRGQFTGELIQVGANLDSTFQTLNGIALMLWIAMPSSLILSIIFGYLLTARSLRPVRAISRAAGELSSDDLSLRLPLPQANDEIRILSDTFNGMLERLDDAFKRLRRFAGNVSHELRTPLSVLRGEAEFALRRERSADEYRAALTTIVRESVHMTEIVEDLLLLARAQGNSIKIDRQLIHVSDFIKGVAVSAEPMFSKHQVMLSPSVSAPLPLIVCENYLGLALKNVLINAAKHSPQGSVVELSVVQDDQGTTFSIQDQGDGIADVDLPYIFDPFYRADTARNRSKGGSGIGLSLAQALVHLHGGKITAESPSGEGAKFLIFIPHAYGLEAEGEQKASFARNRISDLLVKKKRVEKLSSADH